MQELRPLRPLGTGRGAERTGGDPGSGQISHYPEEPEPGGSFHYFDSLLSCAQVWNQTLSLPCAEGTMRRMPQGPLVQSCFLGPGGY